MITVKLIKLHDNAKMPTRNSSEDAGFDLFASENKLLKPLCRCLIGTGIAIELPPLTEAQIRPRSGLASKYGITVLNTPGTVDEGYRGEVKVLLINLGDDDFYVEEGMRIAQLVIMPIPDAEIMEVNVLSESKRGAKGFGSSGLKSSLADD